MNRSALRVAAFVLLIICTGAGLRPAYAAEEAVPSDAAEPGKPASPDADACREAPVTSDDATPTDRSVADAQAALSLDLLRAIATGSDGKGGTISVSPIGIAAVLSGLALGADETMRGAIAKTLRMQTAGEGKGNEKSKGNGKREAELNRLRAALPLLDLGRGSGPVQGAGALFVDHATTLKPGIADRLQAEARMPVRSAALGTQEGVDAVNAFVSQTTNGLIPTILDAPPQDMALVAVNAFRFKDCWRFAFDPADTRKAAFHKADGSQVEVATMRLDEKPLSHAVTDRFAAVDLGYRNTAFSMTLVTTRDRPAGVEAFAKAGAQVGKLLTGDGFGTGPVDLALPVFAAENGRELLPVLAKLGLKAGLESRTALSGFADGIGLGAVHQKTLVAVDEKGTVAAAATAAVATRSASGPRAERIAFDKPFVFALRHRPTGLVLMAGYVGEPKPAAEAGTR